VGTVTRGHEGSREPGSGVRVRVQVQDLNSARHPHLYLNARTRDLRAETWDPKEYVRSQLSGFRSPLGI